MSYESPRFDCCSRQQNLSVFPVFFVISSVVLVNSQFSVLKLTGQLIDLPCLRPGLNFLCEITEIYPRSSGCVPDVLAYLGPHLTTGVSSSLGETIGSHSGDPGSISARGTFLCVWGSIEIQFIWHLKVKSA